MNPKPEHDPIYIADYRFGWTAHTLGTPYAGMNSEGERDGWIAAWGAGLRSPALAAYRAETQNALPAWAVQL